MVDTIGHCYQTSDSPVFLTGDCLDIIQTFPDKHFHLVFGSPPFENKRKYDIGFSLQGQDWVDWMFSVITKSLRACSGLVAFVVNGKTKNHQWSATPSLLEADLHRAGIYLRNPPIYYRHGICGSGGKDWLRCDYDRIICCTNGGALPWSDNTAMGKPPKHKPGGMMSHRTQDGSRVRRAYTPPTKANPGNVIHCLVGGGHMGSKLAHENEAPFPESLAEFFIRSFCPPHGLVLDPFSGSGTTCAVAYKLGRRGVGIDIRESQTQLAKRRCIIE